MNEWTEFKTTLKKEKKDKDKKDKDKKKKRIIKIKGNTFMIETMVDASTRRFNKVDIELNELSELKKQKHVK